MAQTDNSRGRRSIVIGRVDAPRIIILFHGYTGSPGDFGDLPERMAKSLDAQVIVPLLPGHGTRVEELLPLNFDDFLRAAEREIANIAKTGRTFAVGGYSLGAHLAILATLPYKPSAIFIVVIPYHLRFPFSSFLGRWLSRTKKLWMKRLHKENWRESPNRFFYPQMPGKALALINEGNRRLENLGGGIACPILSIHASDDTLAYPESGILSLGHTGAGVKEYLVVTSERHNLFFSKNDREKVFKKISDFLQTVFTLPTL